MSQRAEILFRKLQSRKAIRALIGQSEDGDFDCKEWHGPDAMKISIAKAACGFANATGGVIVFGMSTDPVRPACGLPIQMDIPKSYNHHRGCLRWYTGSSTNL
jgi:predicted HTH transcriptional regulator